MFQAVIYCFEICCTYNVSSLKRLFYYLRYFRWHGYPLFSSSVAKDIIFWAHPYPLPDMIHAHYQSRSQFPPSTLVTIHYDLCRLQGRASLYETAYRKRVRVTGFTLHFHGKELAMQSSSILLITCREAGLQLSQDQIDVGVIFRSCSAGVGNKMHCCFIISVCYADSHVVLKLQLGNFVLSASSRMTFCSKRIGRKLTPQDEAVACISVVGQNSAEVGLDQLPQPRPPCLTLSEPVVSYQCLQRQSLVEIARPCEHSQVCQDESVSWLFFAIARLEQLYLDIFDHAIGQTDCTTCLSVQANAISLTEIYGA